MQTIDDEFTDAATAWMDKQSKAGKPFFCYYNSTRMHIYTHLKPESEGKTGLGLEADGMVEHDAHVGQLLKKLDDLGIADNTIVVYTSDNGAELMTWPDGGKHAIPRRKGHQLGRRLSRAHAHPMARSDQTRHRLQRVLRPRRFPSHVRRGGRQR